MLNIEKGLHFVNWLGQYVLAFDHREAETEEGRKLLLASAASGTGFAAARLVGANWDGIAMALAAMGEAFKDAPVKEGMDLIFFDMAFADALAVEEVTALLWHEAAHIKLGHVERQGHTGNDDEIEADRFAVRYVGKKAMKSALVNFVMRSIDFADEHFGKVHDRNKAMTTLKANPEWTSRMQALA